MDFDNGGEVKLAPVDGVAVDVVVMVTSDVEGTLLTVTVDSCAGSDDFI